MSFTARRVVTAMAVVALSACGGEDDLEQVAISSVTENVEYYPGCQNEPVEIDGATWYPLADFFFDDKVDEITEVQRQRIDTAAAGFRSGRMTPRVAPPGPGDDTGTFVVFEDGYGRFESDNGLAVWMTREAQTYDWVC